MIDNEKSKILRYSQFADWTNEDFSDCGRWYPEPTMLVIQPSAEGQLAIDVLQHEVACPFVPTGNIKESAKALNSTGISAMSLQHVVAEAEYQEEIAAEDFFEEMFDFEACAYHGPSDLKMVSP